MKLTLYSRLNVQKVMSTKVFKSIILHLQCLNVLGQKNTSAFFSVLLGIYTLHRIITSTPFIDVANNVLFLYEYDCLGC